MRPGIKTLLCMLLTICTGTFAAAQAPEPVKAKTSDFVWMTGRWIGHLPDATAEQICSQPQAGEMLCLFRLFQNNKPVMFELYTMQDTANGPELRSLHFATDLNQNAAEPPLVMTLKKYSEKEVVFAGVPGSEVVTSTLVRDTPTTMNGTIILTASKEPHIHVRWEKVDYAVAMK
jgi:hypothetical protein